MIFVISDKIKIDCNLLSTRAIGILFAFVFVYGGIFCLMRKGQDGTFSIFICM